MRKMTPSKNIVRRLEVSARFKTCRGRKNREREVESIVMKAKGWDVLLRDFGFAPIFGVRKRAGQLEWVAEVIESKRSLIKEVREMGVLGTVNIQITN